MGAGKGGGVGVILLKTKQSEGPHRANAGHGEPPLAPSWWLVLGGMAVILKSQA